MPSVGTPASNRPSGTGGAPGSHTEAGPPDKMIPFGRLASTSATGMVEGTISLSTWHSRTRRAMSCAYCAPKSTTRTVSKDCSTDSTDTKNAFRSRGMLHSLVPRRGASCLVAAIPTPSRRHTDRVAATNDIEAELRALADPLRAEQEKRYLK